MKKFGVDSLVRIEWSVIKKKESRWNVRNANAPRKGASVRPLTLVN